MAEHRIVRVEFVEARTAYVSIEEPSLSDEEAKERAIAAVRYVSELWKPSVKFDPSDDPELEYPVRISGASTLLYRSYPDSLAPSVDEILDAEDA